MANTAPRRSGLFAATMVPFIASTKPREVDRLQRQNARTNPRQFGAIRNEPGNLCLRETAWWGWEDSNLQPIDYQSLALSIDQRPACGISWLAKCPIRALRPAISTILWQRLRGRNRYIEIQSAICRNKALVHATQSRERFVFDWAENMKKMRSGGMSGLSSKSAAKRTSLNWCWIRVIIFLILPNDLPEVFRSR